MKRLLLPLALAWPCAGQAQGALIAPAPTPVFQPAGVQGLLLPRYDRVDGLALPLGATITLASDMVVIEPMVTYVSRLGRLDPAIAVRLGSPKGARFEAVAARQTRTNDSWNYSDLVNSATTLFGGVDTRNYFRSSGGEGRMFARVDGTGFVLEPYVGGRYETANAISATGDVFSFTGHTDKEGERIRRPNPLVDEGSIGSAIAGARFRDTAGVVMSGMRLEVERALSTFAGTSTFTQATLDAKVEFPTFRTQRLHFWVHGIATAGDSVPRARYSYLGGSGTLPVLEQLEQGGDELLFVESRYLFPVDRLVLPLVGVPILTLRHLMGAAGVHHLPSLEQEIGLGLGLSVLRFDVTTDAARKRGTKFGLGISLD